MRSVRAGALASLTGLGAGYLLSALSAFWLAAAVPDAEQIWNLVSPLRIGAWIVEAAHGIPTVIRTAAGLSASDASVERLGELLGERSEVVFTFSLFLAPITVLAVVGIVTAVMVRRAAPSTGRELGAIAATTAATHAVALALAAWLSSFTFAAEGMVAPDLGLGAATGRLAVGVDHSVPLALVLGAAWGAAFALAGGLAALPMRTAIRPDDRAVLLGWMRGLGWAAGAMAVLLVVGALGAVVLGRAPSPRLLILGALLLGANAVAAALVFSSGVSMAAALDAGPFTGWERVDLLNVGTGGEAAPVYVWLVLLVPVAVGISAGRFARRRSALSPSSIAVRYGMLWGLTLAVLALLLRVRVLSSFSVGSLDLGGGGAAFDPLVALLVGASVGAVAAFAGARSVADAGTWDCPSCGIANTPDDRFCVSCGTVVGAAT